MGDPTGALCDLLSRAHFAGVPTTRTLWSHVSYALDAAKDELSPLDLISCVLKACLQHPLTTVAPRDPRHDVSVLQWLLDEWKKRGWQIPEVLSSGNLEEPIECPELCYKTYLGWGGSNSTAGNENSRGVTLLESSGGIIHHTTGLTTWGGAAVLASWADDYPQLIAGRRVLELGAGVGFTASVILTGWNVEHPPPVSYVATDCHHHVLTLLHHNLELNLRDEPMKRSELEEFQAATGKVLVSEEVQAGQLVPWNPPSAQLRLSSRSRDLTDTDSNESSPSTCKTRYGTQVEVRQVDWRHPGSLPDVDVIIAADVVYAHHLIPPLVTLIKSILDGTASGKSTKTSKAKQCAKSKNIKLDVNGTGKKSDNKEDNGEREKYDNRDKERGDVERVAYIACTRRTHETMTVFLEEVARQGLVHSLVYQITLDTDTFLFLYNETHLPIKIYQLSLPPRAN